MRYAGVVMSGLSNEHFDLLPSIAQLERRVPGIQCAKIKCGVSRSRLSRRRWWRLFARRERSARWRPKTRDHLAMARPTVCLRSKRRLPTRSRQLAWRRLILGFVFVDSSIKKIEHCAVWYL